MSTPLAEARARLAADVRGIELSTHGMHPDFVEMYLRGPRERLAAFDAVVSEVDALRKAIEEIRDFASERAVCHGYVGRIAAMAEDALTVQHFEGKIAAPGASATPTESGGAFPVGNDGDPGAACHHDNHHFDRSICACGVMHHYCDDCGQPLEPCSAVGHSEGSSSEVV